MKYEIKEYGSATVILTRFITVEADSSDEALKKLAEFGKGAFTYTEDFNLDDDYSDFEYIKEIKD